MGPLAFLWRLRREIRKYRWHLILLGLLGSAAYAQSLITPQLTRKIIDVAYLQKHSLRLFFQYSAGIVLLNVFAAAIQSVSGYISTYTNNMIGFRIRMRVFRALHRAPVSFVEGHHSGMFVERIATDADQAAGMLSGFVPQVISLVLTTIATIIMMANISILVTALVLVMIPLYYLINTTLSIKLREWHRRTRMKDEELTTRAIEAIQGVTTARLFGVGEWLKAMYTRLLRDRIKMAFGIWKANVTWGQLGWAVSYGWGVLLTVGGWYLVFQDRLSLGDAVALGMYIPLLLRPAEQALGLYQSLLASSVPAQRIAEILTAAGNGRPAAPRQDFILHKCVRLEGATFSYPGISWSLKRVNMSVQCGESAVVIGPTGSGKTTLLKLLAGIYELTDGALTADGIEISRIGTQSYQANAAMVMADNFFFSGTLMENLRIARSDVSEDEVRETARILGLDDWLSTLPAGYGTALGVGGIRLSSGQIQKIAILRALLKRPRVLLLDELTSAMDVESERDILSGMRKLRPEERITVMTTHRLTLTAKPWVDMVIVLDDGSVVEQGNPEELYRRNGRYRLLMDLAGIGALVSRRPESPA